MDSKQPEIREEEHPKSVIIVPEGIGKYVDKAEVEHIQELYRNVEKYFEILSKKYGLPMSGPGKKYGIKVTTGEIMKLWEAILV